MHIDPVGEPVFVANKGGYTLTIQKGSFLGRPGFMPLIRSFGSDRNGQFRDTFEEAKEEGLKLLHDTYEKGERDCQEFEREQTYLRIKRLVRKLSSY